MKLLQLVFSFNLLFVFLCSCQSDNSLEVFADYDVNNIEPEVIDTTISFLALGDSYTIGQGVVEAMRWPNQLAVEMRDSNIAIEDPLIIAQTGWTTFQLKTAIELEEPGKHDLVSLLIGVNNQFQKRPFEEFQSQFLELLDISKELASETNDVFVVSIPDYGVTPFGSNNAAEIASELDMYNAYIKEICADQGILFIEVTDISRELGDSPGALAQDQLHPSGEQYAAWVERMLTDVIELVR